MNGAGSPGQQRWTGRSPRSTSSPRRTISWQMPFPTVFGRESAIDFELLQAADFLHQPARRLHLEHVGDLLATSSSRWTPNARHILRSVPNWLIRSGCSDPFGFSNSSAGPPAFTVRSTISVISRSGSTSAETRTSSPSRSSSAIQSRRSRGPWRLSLWRRGVGKRSPARTRALLPSPESGVQGRLRRDSRRVPRQCRTLLFNRLESQDRPPRGAASEAPSSRSGAVAVCSAPQRPRLLGNRTFEITSTSFVSPGRCSSLAHARLRAARRLRARAVRLWIVESRSRNMGVTKRLCDSQALRAQLEGKLVGPRRLGDRRD